MASKEPTKGTNRWLVDALAEFQLAANANGCLILNADIAVAGLAFSDRIKLGDAEFHIHARFAKLTPEEKEKING